MILPCLKTRKTRYFRVFSVFTKTRFCRFCQNVTFSLSPWGRGPENDKTDSLNHQKHIKTVKNTYSPWPIRIKRGLKHGISLFFMIFRGLRGHEKVSFSWFLINNRGPNSRKVTFLPNPEINTDLWLINTDIWLINTDIWLKFSVLSKILSFV